MKIWLHSMAYPVTALGPGRRVALWVSGCSRRCRGCITPELWARDAGIAKDTDAVACRLLAIEQTLDGLTITGGEPFEQPAALAELIGRLAAERPQWTILVYTGHTLAALRRQGEQAQALLARADVLIAGPYRAERPASHPLAGSGNQRVHWLSERGRGMRDAIDALAMGQVNLGLSADGHHGWLIGTVDTSARNRITAALATHRADHASQEPRSAMPAQ